MRRRDFLRLASAAAAAPAWPLAIRAQGTAKVPRVALASAATQPSAMVIGGNPRWSAFVDEMAIRGFIEGKTVVYERYLTPSDDTAPANARLILQSKPDVIFWAGAAAATLAAIALDKTTPMVVSNTDLLAQGFVKDVRHPGGNVTGVSSTAGPGAESRNVAALAEAVPNAKRFAYVISGSGGNVRPLGQAQIDEVMSAASKFGVSIVPIIIDSGVATQENFAKAFREAVANRADAVVLANDTTTLVGSAMEAKLWLEAKLPAISSYTDFTDAGGLMSQGPDLTALMRQGADYVALILNGANSGNLPVLQPTVFQLVINLKTAKAIGVTIPPSLLAQATEVIQ